jgi:hypothetical protein
VLTEFRDLNSDISQQAFQLLLDHGYRLVLPTTTTTTTTTNGSRRSSTSTVTSLEETKRYLQRLARHPMSDPTRTFTQKIQSIFLQSFITDLWFTLDQNYVNPNTA